MTNEHIIELAKKRSAAWGLVEALALQNTLGKSLEQKIAQDARYRLAQDAYAKATNDYVAAISSLSADQISELAR